MKSKSIMTLYLVYRPDGSINDAVFVSAVTPEDAALLYVKEIVEFEGEQKVAVEEAPIVDLIKSVHPCNLVHEFTVRKTIEVTLIDEPQPDEPDEQDSVVRLHPLSVANAR